ncbi:hypothetical protein [Deinococcus budaensis]|uniref:Uncharacterized protein n=1 Tax=Deinococcus budaensis TaxID=1665626 RepID=A0A7W8GH63_9DEIO|nr:hypothetical protein [Deinococcus budaensis]MBB5235547.1 hypothetical protein [Deinococcus budaensis]
MSKTYYREEELGTVLHQQALWLIDPHNQGDQMWAVTGVDHPGPETTRYVTAPSPEKATEWSQFRKVTGVLNWSRTLVQSAIEDVIEDVEDNQLPDREGYVRSLRQWIDDNYGR